MPPPPPEEQKHSLARIHIERSQSRTTTPQGSTGTSQRQDDRPEPGADTDSAFDDDASLISGSSGSSEESRRTQSKVEDTAAQKAEEIKIALKKIQEASIQKVFLKVFCEDGSTKSLVADERMTVYFVLKILVEKCHVKHCVDWALVETLPDLYMERHLEEDELIVENLLNWKVGSENRILFERRPARHDLFRQPELYLLQPGTTILPHTRKTLLEDFFSPSNGSVPNIEGPLWLKSEGKKNWKKHFFVLKSSGLYYIPKGKKSSPNLVCFATFDVNQAYTGVGWKKKFKSPTDFCFAIKHPRIQEKSPKYIWYLCAETEESLNRWLTGIRILKRKTKLLENFKLLQEDLTQPQQKAPCEVNHPAENNRSDSRESRNLNNDIIYSPASESRSFDSGVSSISEASSDVLCSSSGETSVSVSMSRSESLLSKSSNGSDTSDSAFETDSPAGGTIKRNPKLAVAPATMEPVEEIGADSEECDLPGSGNFQQPSFEQISSTIRRKCTEMTKLETCLNLDASNNEKMTNKSFHPPLENCEDESLPPPPPEAYECFSGRRASNTSVQSLPPPPPLEPDTSKGLENSKFAEWNPEEKSLSCAIGPQVNNIYPTRQELNQQQGSPNVGWQQANRSSIHSQPTTLNQQSVFYPQRIAATTTTGLYSEQQKMQQSHGPVKMPQTNIYGQHSSNMHQSPSNLQSDFIYPGMRGQNPLRPESPSLGHTDGLSKTYPTILLQSESRPQPKNGMAHQQMELLSRIPNEAPLRPSFVEGSQFHNQQVLAISQQENTSLQQYSSPNIKKKSSLKQTSNSQDSPKLKVIKATKKISFDDRVQSLEHSPPVPSSPSSHPDQPNWPIIERSIRKPNPGKLFSPQSAAATPPREFLADLQRVMSTKLNLSEKCPTEFSKPAQDYNERDVSNWILQSLKHYRAANDDIRCTGGNTPEQQSHISNTSHYTTSAAHTSQPFTHITQNPHSSQHPTTLRSTYGIYQGSDGPLNISQPFQHPVPYDAARPPNCHNIIYQSINQHQVPTPENVTQSTSGNIYGTFQNQNLIYESRSIPPGSACQPIHSQAGPTRGPQPRLFSQNPISPQSSQPQNTNYVRLPATPPSLYQSQQPLHPGLINTNPRYCLQRSQSANTHRQLFQEKYPQRFYDDQTMSSNLRSNSPIYGTGMENKRVPPPPPKRSETTQLSHNSRL
eukprot:TRINITY_DN195_c0_g1_i1.p1 TRINITY_DN195_c0_g1~~TRINITY_DN195_c0_g1_i1.p1  ORF type:complete len:1319 (-),score=197.56 TRINITY_DN195_c0_g1_i1:182-3745(-)